MVGSGGVGVRDSMWEWEWGSRVLGFVRRGSEGLASFMCGLGRGLEVGWLELSRGVGGLIEVYAERVGCWVWEGCWVVSMDRSGG